MTFDRLIYIDRLKVAGVDEATARAHAEALRDALAETVATKSDLHDAVTTLDRKIEDTFGRLDRKIDEKSEALDRKIELLDRKIEISVRDVTIKGAGGLAIIVSLMIGLKLFG